MELRPKDYFLIVVLRSHVIIRRSYHDYSLFGRIFILYYSFLFMRPACGPI